MNTLRDNLLVETGGDVDKAACLLAVRLMEGEPEMFKQGYTRPNAVIAASEVFGIERERIDAMLSDDPHVLRMCEWFALCDNPATKTRSHPVLGAVPICDRCDAKVEAL